MIMICDSSLYIRLGNESTCELDQELNLPLWSWKKFPGGGRVCGASFVFALDLLDVFLFSFPCWAPISPPNRRWRGF